MATDVTVPGDGAIEKLRTMSYYAVIREAGPSWTGGGIAEQPDVADHAAFMNDLAGEGFVLFAGPLAGTENGLLRALLILKADLTRSASRRCAGGTPRRRAARPISRPGRRRRRATPSPGAAIGGGWSAPRR
jgi:hypothetical protein